MSLSVHRVVHRPVHREVVAGERLLACHGSSVPVTAGWSTMRIRGAVLEQIGSAPALRRITAHHGRRRRPGGTRRLRAAGPHRGRRPLPFRSVGGRRQPSAPGADAARARGSRVSSSRPGAAVADMAVGQRVVMTFLPRCGHCRACATDGLTPCEPGSAANGAGTLLGRRTRLSRDGQPVIHHLGVSGFATHAVVDRRSVVPVDRRRAAGGRVAARMRGAHRRRSRPQRRPAAAGPDRRRRRHRRRRHGRGADRTGARRRHASSAVDQLADKLDRARVLGAHEAYTSDEVGERGSRPLS